MTQIMANLLLAPYNALVRLIIDGEYGGK